MKAQQAVRLAWQHHTIVPAFNIPYLPMAKPVAQAIIDEKTVAMLQVARLEWEKFESRSLEAVAEEYFKYYDPKYTLLHLDHVPVIDEDQKRVDYMPILERAVKAGYQSVMVDGSRLKLAENIAVTKQVADFAHANDIACEAELGSVMGHEGAGANMDYEEIFRTKKGFTDLGEAKQFAEETKWDWLSVAVGSIHGAIAEGVRNQKKPEARLDIEHIADLRRSRASRSCCTAAPASTTSVFSTALQTALRRSMSAPRSARPTNAHWARRTTWKRPAPPSIPARARSSARSALKAIRKSCSDK